MSLADPKHARSIHSDDSETDDSLSDESDNEFGKKEKLKLVITKLLTGYKEDEDIEKEALARVKRAQKNQRSNQILQKYGM